MWSSSAAASSARPRPRSSPRLAPRVTLVERDGLASGASGANSGVVQHPFDPVLAGLYRETLALYRDLATADVGFRIGAEPAGLLYVSADEDAVRHVDRSLAEAFPGPGPGRGGRRRPHGDRAGCRAGHVGLPGRHRLPGRARRLDLRLRDDRRTPRGRRPDGPDGRRSIAAATLSSGVVVDGETTPADAVLVAAGPWSPSLIDPTGAWRPIRERWGVVVETELPTGPTHVLEEAEIGAAIGTRTEPARGRRRRPASTSASCPSTGSPRSGRPSWRAEPDPGEWMERILTRASRFVPAVADAPIRGTRACARPQSLDGRPLVGRRARRARPVRLRRTRRVGDLDRSGVGAPDRGRDPGPLAAHPCRARSGQVRGAASPRLITSIARLLAAGGLAGESERDRGVAVHRERIGEGVRRLRWGHGARHVRQKGVDPRRVDRPEVHAFTRAKLPGREEKAQRASRALSHAPHRRWPRASPRRHPGLRDPRRRRGPSSAGTRPRQPGRSAGERLRGRSPSRPGRQSIRSTGRSRDLLEVPDRLIQSIAIDGQDAEVRQRRRDPDLVTEPSSAHQALGEQWLGRLELADIALDHAEAVQLACDRPLVPEPRARSPGPPRTGSSLRPRRAARRA